MNIKKILIILLTIIITMSSFVQNVSAANNPYGQYQTIDGITTVRCTYYAWQQAYDRTGVALPNFGNAKNWYSGAQNAGYSTGTVAKPNSIAVWTSSYGHVAYVVSVSGSTMTVNEGGMTINGTAANGTGIINGSICNSTVGSKKSQYSSNVLLGFIYLTDTGSAENVKITYNNNKSTITENNAVLWGWVDKPSNSSVTKIGIKIRKDGSTYDKGWSKYETPSRNYVGEPSMQPYYDLNAELNFYPTHATKYYMQFYAVVNGKEYWSDENSFTTAGTHSFSNWTTTKTESCTENGSKKRSCSCGLTETASISALGHNYSTSWTIDTTATCTTAGSKSHHCTRCSAKTSVTPINATGHSWSSWATTQKSSCTSAGQQARSCNICKTKETKTINANGHSFSSAWTIDTPSTCTESGTKSKHCNNCTSKTTITTIPATGHNWSEFKTTTEATVTQNGSATRRCLNAGCIVTETKTIPKLSEDGHTHTFGNWEIIKNVECENDGEQQRKCTICNQSETQILSATGHSFSEWSQKDKNGIITRTCTKCYISEEQIIESDENNFTNNIESNTENTKDAVSNVIETPEKDNNNNIVLFVIIAIISILITAVAITLLIIKNKNRN